MKNINLYKSALDNSFDGVLISDSEGNILYLNKRYEIISGLSKEQLIGKNLQDLEDEGLFSMSISMKVIKDKKAFSTIHSYVSGKSALSSAVPIFHKNELVGVVNNTRNLALLQELEEEVLKSAENCVETRRKKLSYKELLNKEYNFVFASESMSETIKKANLVAPYDSTVLITGDSGTGKEIIARYIHNTSPRKDETFIKVNCAAIPSELIESELFGYEEGAFTGAKETGRIGYFELAHEGTLLLDEIGDMPLDMQAKLLRTIQEGEIQRLGSNKTIKINVRILAATNLNLEKAVEENKFREDLYYRLSVFPIHIDPLTKRQKDIIPMAQFFLKRLNKKYKSTITIDDEALKALSYYSFPGNVRELENLVEYMYVLCEESITISEIPGKVLSDIMIHTTGNDQKQIYKSLDQLMELYEKSIIKDIIKHHKTLASAAEIMDIQPSTLSRKMYKYGLEF